MKIILRKKNFQNSFFDQFRDSIYEAEMKYLASELTVFDPYDHEIVEEAVSRAMNICKAANIPLSMNFKPVYSEIYGKIIPDWKLSDLSRKLVLLNADPNNPLIAKLQIALISNYGN